MDPQRLRSWWFERQALPNGLPTVDPADILLRSGWSRSVGGANPYLTLFARGGTSRADADQGVAELKIHELPCARGCTYVVPHQEFALALKVGQSKGDPADIAGAKKFLGVTDAELDRLAEKVVDALDSGPKDPAALKEAVGDAVRSLGPEGKKRGMTTTLPMVLGRLQTQGEIRRQPTNGRIDQQRYLYARWSQNPLKDFSLSIDEAMVELARRFFRWIGPATPGHFQWFSGLGVKAAKAALEPLGLVPIEVGDPLLILPEDLDALLAHTVPDEPRYALVSGLDAIFLHRRDVAPLVDESDRAKFGPSQNGLLQPSGLQDLTNNAILDRGRLVGLWEYEPSSKSVVTATLTPPDSLLQAEISRTEAFIQEQLGDCRSFSLDSPESRQATIDALRQNPLG